ncbi:unnamed protein product [Blepharisma stoltei]|uniref:Class I SAM-dependent methyltransferase n=1 Tax=Blepharisma stoltei TaxID=1481888 RepID=A0AAU9JX79_9CILI|nr:unnamed protein product [Blepharisma stoltei]
MGSMSIINIAVLFQIFCVLSQARDVQWNSVNPYSENSPKLEADNKIAIFTALEKIPKDDKRFITFSEAMKLMIYRNSKNLIELGTEWGEEKCTYDGCSTSIFGLFAYATEKFLISVDNDQNAVYKAKEATKWIEDNVSVIKSDSVEFLKNYDKPIDFLYIDSMDYDEKILDHIQHYHLEEIKAAYRKLHKYSIVLLDEGNMDHGGSNKLVYEYLENLGWERVVNKWQYLYVHKDSLL